MAQHEPRQPNGQRFDYVTLCMASPDMLEDVMRRGSTPELERLAGWEFRGYNTPEFAALLGIKKFKKGFYKDGANATAGRIQGYNVEVKQSPIGVGDPWVDAMKGADSHKFGWYNVYPVDLSEPDAKYPNAVLINYDSDKNFKLDPTRLLRDYLVQVYADNPDLYLGKAFIALGPVRVFVSYFVLERSNRSSLAQAVDEPPTHVSAMRQA
ncbi:MAG TPA: hypothetical protein VGQ83_39535 [Polyangia bacterium]|jgi:hypothetical protein